MNWSDADIKAATVCAYRQSVAEGNTDGPFTDSSLRAIIRILDRWQIPLPSSLMTAIQRREKRGVSDGR